MWAGVNMNKHKTMIGIMQNNHISQLTYSLLQQETQPLEVRKYLNEINTHFQTITGLDAQKYQVENLAAIPAAKGRALGLHHAAQCLLDYQRTIRFLKATRAAIEQKRKEQPNKVIHVLYAGCGPYAPFITLIAPFFQPKEVQFSLIEINKKSMGLAQKCIHALNLSAYVKETYVADAVSFKIPEPEVYDILISETLDALLYRECYVPILCNLLPQLRKDILVIPENVTVELSFLQATKKEETPKVLELGSVFNVREAIASHATIMNTLLQFPAYKINLNSLRMEHYEKMRLDTKVHIYDDLYLHRNESSLTIPLEFKLAQPFQKNTVMFAYFMEPDIELKCTFH